MDSEKIGKLIKDIRLKNNLTQAKFADSLGVTYQAVSKWENGKNIPDIAIIKIISEKYNVSILSLLDTEEKKVKKNSFIYLGAVLLLIIMGLWGFYLYNHNHEHDFEFKTITSNCSSFNISGSIAYNKNKSAIHISNINYCGGNDENIYESIECTLYKVYGNVETKLETKDSNEPETLESFLQDISFKVDSKGTDCRLLSSSKITLNIKALKKDGIVVNYDVPLRFDSTC